MTRVGPHSSASSRWPEPTATKRPASPLEEAGPCGKMAKTSHGALFSVTPLHHPDQFRLCYTPSPTLVVPSQQRVSILTPSRADREVRRLVLPNGMKCYLVSDPHLKQSGAVVAVQRGSFDEPRRFPGLAHFLEHELFMGTVSYPGESAFTEFLQENGGCSNAYTADSRTCYAFVCRHQALEEGLDRFSGFFREPLFNPSGIEREMNAVHQEFSKCRNADGWRENMVLSHLAREEHPYHSFTIGNLDTLKEIEQEALLQWHRENYLAGEMYTIVYGNASCDQLQNWVEKDFGSVPAGKVREERAHPGALFAPETLGQWLDIATVADVRELELVFPLPEEFAGYFESKPTQIVSHVLGDESDTSLLAQLKREGLAEGLSAYSSKKGAHNPLFALSINLTGKGLEQKEEVVKRCFQAIEGFRRAGCPEYLFDQIKGMATLNYQFQQDGDLFSQLWKECGLIHEEDLATYPEKSYIPQEFRPDLVAELLTHLKPENALFVVNTLRKDPDTLGQKEPWMQVPYETRRVNNALMKEWASAEPHSAIALPVPNPYLPELLELRYEREVSRLIPTPTQLVSSPSATLYYAPDTRYLVPKVWSRFHLITPEVRQADAKSQALNLLLAYSIEEKLNPITYQADEGKLHFEVQATEKGMAVLLSGFDEKAPRLLKDLAGALKEAMPTPENFAIYRNALQRDLENSLKQYPYLTAAEAIKSILNPQNAGVKALAEALGTLSYQDLEQFAHRYFQAVHVESTVYGNVDENCAKQMLANLEGALGSRPYPKALHPKEWAPHLPTTGPLFTEHEVEIFDNAAMLAVQCAEAQMENRAAWEVLVRSLADPFFEELRTKQQTGYIVKANSREEGEQLFLQFLVQSGKHDPRDLCARFELFLENFLKGIGQEGLTKEKFTAIRDSLLEELSKPPTNLEKMGGTLDAFAYKRKENFAFREQYTQAIQSLTFEEFVSKAREWLGPQNKQRLAALVYGKTEAAEGLRYAKALSTEAVVKETQYKPLA